MVEKVSIFPTFSEKLDFGKYFFLVARYLQLNIIISVQGFQLLQVLEDVSQIITIHGA